MVTTFERMVTIMKMQNAELEFVAFDAQDVIATSGDPKSVTFANFGNGNRSDRGD